MADKFKIFTISLIVLLIIVFGYITFKLNEKNNLLNQEIEKVKNEYATKVQVPEIIFQKIDQCQRIQVTKNKWSYDSDNIYARDVCQTQGKSCFSATMIAMEGATTPWNAFSKGNFGCSMPLSKAMLQDDSSRGSTSSSGLFDSYEIVCC